MASENFNSLGGFSANWPPVQVVDASGNVTTNVVVPTGNVTSNTVFANAYYYGNGQPFSSEPAGSNTQVQFNNAGVFAGDAGFVYDLDTDLLTATSIAGEGGNISNVQVANVTGLGNIATINLTGSTTSVLYGNGVFSALPAIDSNFANYAGNVVESAQPNITSVGTLTSLTVGTTINATDISASASLGADTLLISETSQFNGNVTFASGANISAAGNVQLYNSPNVNLAIANLHIDGGLNGQVLSTDGAGNLSWTAGGGSTGFLSVTSRSGVIEINISAGYLNIVGRTGTIPIPIS